MDSVNVPLRSSGKKMRKRRELDALVAHSLAKRYHNLGFDQTFKTREKQKKNVLIVLMIFNRACNSGKRQAAGNGINSQDQLLSASTDDQEEYSLVAIVH